MDDKPNLESKFNILLIDDDSFISVAYSEGLERSGYNVSVARDGEQGLMLVKTSSPDLILLDLLIPKINGFEVLQNLKDNPATKNIPVIVLTNLSQESDETEARSYGIKDFMVKADISLKDLVHRIDGILKIN